MEHAFVTLIHVTDLASAHVRALKALDGGCNQQSFNLGTGRGLREVIAIAQTITGWEIGVKEGPRRAGDPPRLIADASRAMTELGWRPEYTDLCQIIATAWDWMSNRQVVTRPIQRLPHVVRTS